MPPSSSKTSPEDYVDLEFSDVSVDELASTFKGITAASCVLPAHEKVIGRFVDQSVRLSLKDKAKYYLADRRFYAEFAARHLPVFISLLPSLAKIDRGLSVFLMAIGVSIAHTSHFPMWVRVAPWEDVEAGLNALIRTVQRAIPGVDITHGPGGREEEALMSASCLLVAILISLPPSFNNHTAPLLFPWFNASSFQRFSASFLSAGRQIPPHEGKDRSEVHQALARFSSFLSLHWTVEDLRRSTIERLKVPWHRCEGFEEGMSCVHARMEEMMACGKCKAVRYCSREHQRSHWPTHKKTYVSPFFLDSMLVGDGERKG